MNLKRRIQINFEDLATFGPQFLWRHSARVTKSKTVLVNAGGSKIYVRAGESDVAAVRQVFGSNQYGIAAVIRPLDDRINARYQSICDAGLTPVIVDAGANIGAASLWFKRRFPLASVVAIEPAPGNFSVLLKNASLVDNVLPIQAAIGSSSGFVSLKSFDMGWATQTERSERGIPIVTMEEAFARIPNGAPFIAKIDIEGFESDLFSENIDWLGHTFVVHIEPHDWMMPGRGASLSFQRAMAMYDYELFIAGEILTYVRLDVGQ